jgi:hypothetical protein
MSLGAIGMSNATTRRQQEHYKVTPPRHRYLRSYADGLYVYYKEPKDKVAEVTCSEAHGTHTFNYVYRI